MKFGILFLPTYVPELDGSEAQAYQNMLEQVDRAEALGFESVWLTEHHFPNYGGLVPSPPILVMPPDPSAVFTDSIGASATGATLIVAV